MMYLFVTWRGSSEEGDVTAAGSLYGPLPPKVGEALYRFLIESARGVDQVWTMSDDWEPGPQAGLIHQRG